MTKAPVAKSKRPRNCAAAPGRILGSIGVVGGVAWPGRGVTGAGKGGAGAWLLQAPPANTARGPGTSRARRPTGRWRKGAGA